MKNEWKVAQTLSDMLLFENQIPFFVVFELLKLKRDKSDAATLLKELLELVKNCYMNQVHKLTLIHALPSCKYNPENLPKHLLEVVHSCCMPTNITTTDEDFTGFVSKQMKTATELEQYGVSFKKSGKVHSVFDMDFNRGIMKIRCFRIDDFTETLLRNMIAYEQHYDLAIKYFSDFVLFMSHLIHTPEDAKLVCGSGIIVNFQATGMEQLFSELRLGINTSTTSTLATLSGVINNVNQYCEMPWNNWMRMLRQDLVNSAWKPILANAGVISISLGIAVYIKTLVK
ncbi:PREDICTED: putative UPF0481 protein At3g02645 [Ipomoea nil]|uniref:putative UPF0481 protein At3g02645 n=1 Tax=Ipomoea nil TaxID=35883 RepID=UPI0009013694|nr:PREDICTED: putative UPF0481 protein At3g02645 [Ipomoea nil]